MWLWTLGGGANGGQENEGQEDQELSDDEIGGRVVTGFTLEYDAARKIAQGLGVHLEQIASVVEIKGDKTRLRGVSQGLLGYATKDDKGRLTLVRYQASLSESEVEIDDGVFILKKEDADKLVDPPRLAQITVTPEQVALKPGERASFTITARDQYGQPYAVQVSTDGLQAIAQVRITKAAVAPSPSPTAAPTPPAKPEKQTIRWSGEIPPQKWMNFYTKVLSRFVSTPGLKVRVSFEVPAEGHQAESKANEASSGLKELGLDDNVSVG